MAQKATEAIPTDQNVGAEVYGRIRTVVADDSDVILDAVCALLDSSEQVDIVGRANNGVEVLETVAAVEPDLVLMDVNMSTMNGIQASILLARHFPQIKVILMSAIDSPKIREQCRSVGADGYARKTNFTEEFNLALQNIFSFSQLNSSFTA